MEYAKCDNCMVFQNSVIISVLRDGTDLKIMTA